MKLSRYLTDKWASLIIALVTNIFLAVVLWVLGLNTAAIIFVEILIALGITGSVALDYLRRRRFYTNLATATELLDKKHLIAEVISQPDFFEGILTYEALQEAGKSMNDTIASYRIASEEYQTYIETWVHEIKTPIAAAELIIENNRSSTSTLFGSELARIEEYVEQALYYARSTNVEQDYAIRTVNLETLVKMTLRKRARVLIDQGVTPRLGELNFEVFADAKWLDFIVGQIIGNSVKYRTKEDTAYIDFHALILDEGQVNERVILEITDNGIGIPDSDIARAFDKGFTGENGRVYTKSTGIGLYLCKRLCDKMGLGIEIFSTMRACTTVCISFPKNAMYLI
jgi:signal transduction histidine kinase